MSDRRHSTTLAYPASQWSDAAQHQQPSTLQYYQSHTGSRGYSSYSSSSPSDEHHTSPIHVPRSYAATSPYGSSLPQSGSYSSDYGYPPATYPTSSGPQVTHQPQPIYPSQPMPMQSQSTRHGHSHSHSHPPSHHPYSPAQQHHIQSRSYTMPQGYGSPSEPSSLEARYRGHAQMSSSPPSQGTQYPASPARPFSCDLCALSFNRQHDLKRHRETHTGDKPFLCSGPCGKTFTRKDALKRHQLVKQCGRTED